jgi:putative Mn2+ efflux pump MntP
MSWDTSLTMISGYSSVFRLAEIGILSMAVVSFLVGAYTRGAREYLYIALGALLVSLGRGFLLSADSWATPLPGLIMLILGTWFITRRLHQVYLWL